MILKILLSFDPVRRQRDGRDERPREVWRLDTMPTDRQERIDAAIESERATTFEVVAHAIADMTVEHERQIAELKREVEILKADHTAVDLLQQFSDKLDRTLPQCTELIDRLDRGPLSSPRGKPRARRRRAVAAIPPTS
jgi:hypothetical protein